MSANPDVARLSLRPMTAADVEAVVALETQAYAHAWTRRNFADSLNAGYPAWLLLAGTELVGYNVAMQVADEIHLLNITVAPRHQRLGLGRWMLQDLVTRSLAQGARWIWLEVRASNTPARRLYEGFGFQQVGERKDYYPAAHGQREHAVIMSLRLEP
jgi:[ribosomal protein S18]-alanine N-acetyltransferase